MKRGKKGKANADSANAFKDEVAVEVGDAEGNPLERRGSSETDTDDDDENETASE